jgi:uncharacterized protein YkwD
MLAFNPTGAEQEMLELINHLRANPLENFETMVSDSQVRSFLNTANVSIATARAQFRQLSTGTAPLAWNETGLLDSADTHVNTMKNSNQLTHSNHAPEAASAANVTAPQQVRPISLHASLAIDFVTRGSAGDANRDGILDDPAHREILLDDSLDTVGIGAVSNRRGTQNELWVSEQFAHDETSDLAYLLGVIYNDSNRDGRYNAGEGLGNVRVQIVGGGGTRELTTTSSGAYQVELPAGSYTVAAESSAVGGRVAMGTVSLGTHNVKLDLETRTGTTTRPDDGDPGTPNPPSTTGQVTGFVFFDTNRDGVRLNGEPALAGWTIFADANHNGRLDSGERSARSSATGFYRLTGVAPGDVTVRALAKAGRHFTSDSTRYVEVAASSVVTGQNFGASTRATRGALTGFVFHDVNADQRKQVGDAGLAGWTVYVDANSNAALDSGELFTKSTDTGFYALRDLTPGTYSVRVTPASGSGLIAVSSPVRTATVVAGKITGGNHFTFTTGSPVLSASVTGFVYIDQDRDGRRDANETGVRQETVFVDSNNNGRRDSGEIFAVTSATGFYRLSGLKPGQHTIIWEANSGNATTMSWTLTVGPGGLITGRNFGLLG